MKKIIFLLLFGIPLHSFSQTGLNTKKPIATVEILKGSNVSPENGVLMPRTTGSDLAENDALYSQNQNGTMIYVTSAVPAEMVTPKTIEVTQKGFYVYHDEPYQQWKPTISGKSAMTAAKVFVIINSAATRLMASATEVIRWNADFDGVNKNLIALRNNGTEIVLPPYRTLKIQGMIPVGYGAGSDAQRKIASSLRSEFIVVNPDSTVQVYESSQGFARSSNYNASNAGGSTPAMIIIYTGVSGAIIKTNATREGNLRTNIAGGPAHNTIGSYLIIEEI
ncbi:hypothetical protein [Flavobacterium sp. NKUCC04_CG]|uniref:hypothetical protein n=1 Tax=Flavobacterium sp. NKUCC04_CG TaxID=2842121 RepID=UPI001C5B0B3A|nr:hypothetical protein [Flavobacterium sp. NKUCC04_CG]MBW3520270.1 hypothetical protein [Flavobacterium sp. NKUCC04_CG]